MRNHVKKLAKLRGLRSPSAESSAKNLESDTMIGWRIFAAGVFLSPFALLAPKPGTGVSFGDIFLLVGGLLILVGGIKGTSFAPNETSVVVFYVAGTGLALSVLISGLLASSSMMDVLKLACQYLFVLAFIPAILAKFPTQFRIRTASIFVHGFAMSVVIGLAIITLFPSGADQLNSSGIMAVKAGDRYGLFTGINELAKTSAMSVPIIYYLVVTGYLSALRTALLGGACMMAIVVPRSGSGFLTSILVLLTLCLGHILWVRDRGQAKSSDRKSRHGLLMVTASVATVALVLNRSDASGGAYWTKFTSRVTDPLFNSGVTSVGSAHERIQLIHEAWQVIGAHPVWGIGPGVYVQQSEFQQAVHVVPLMLWAETGIFALFVWMCMIVGFVVMIARARKTMPTTGVMTLAILVALLIAHATGPYFYPRALVLPVLIGFFLLRTHILAPNSPECFERHEP